MPKPGNYAENAQPPELRFVAPIPAGQALGVNQPELRNMLPVLHYLEVNNLPETIVLDRFAVNELEDLAGQTRGGVPVDVSVASAYARSRRGQRQMAADEAQLTHDLDELAGDSGTLRLQDFGRAVGIAPSALSQITADNETPVEIESRDIENWGSTRVQVIDRETADALHGWHRPEIELTDWERINGQSPDNWLLKSGQAAKLIPQVGASTLRRLSIYTHSLQVGDMDGDYVSVLCPEPTYTAIGEVVTKDSDYKLDEQFVQFATSSSGQEFIAGERQRLEEEFTSRVQSDGTIQLVDFAKVLGGVSHYAVEKWVEKLHIPVIQKKSDFTRSRAKNSAHLHASDARGLYKWLDPETEIQK